MAMEQDAVPHSAELEEVLSGHDMTSSDEWCAILNFSHVASAPACQQLQALAISTSMTKVPC